MKNICVLPADTYTVINKTVIADKDRKILSMMYQPIIGFTAISLYYTFIDDLDKLEIIDIARKIDTYETSILPYEDCCTVFVPKHPVINPKEDICIKEENRFDYLSMIDEAITSMNTITVTDTDSSFHDFL